MITRAQKRRQKKIGESIVMIDCGIVIPKSCIAGRNDLTIGFGIMVLSDGMTYVHRAVANFPSTIYRFYTGDEVSSFLNDVGFSRIQILNQNIASEASKRYMSAFAQKASTIERRNSMKHQFCKLLTIATPNAALVANASAMSSTAGTQKDTSIAQLDRQAHRLEWAAQSTKGSARALREQQSLRVKKVIQRLQAGETVDSQEVDKLLNEQPWPQ